MNKARGLKIGVIGVGSMGSHHARILCSLSGVSLEAVADPDETRGKEIAQRYGAHPFTDYKEMLPQVDAVIVVAPTALHYEIGVECINAGKNILIEKPLAKTSEDAQKLVALAKEKKVLLAVGHIERFNPAYQELCKLVKNERILGIDIKRLSPFPERITDANVIQDMMIHDLDLLVNLLPTDEIEEMKAKGKKVKSDKLDTVSATYYFKSGTIAKVSADRVFGIKARKIVVTAESGLYEADLLNKKVYVRDLKNHLPSVHHTKPFDQLTAELTDFIKAIKQGSKHKVDAEDGYRAIKLAEEVEKACS